MVNSVVLLIVVVVIVLGILLSFGLFFLLRNSDTEQTTNALISSRALPSSTILPFASCQTSSQCLTSQICSNGRCTNVVENTQNNLGASTLLVPPPPVRVSETTKCANSVEEEKEDTLAQEIENLERMMERQSGDLRSLQSTLEKHIETNQNKFSNLENTIISKGIRDLPPPPSTRRNVVRDLPPPSYVQDDEDFMETTPPLQSQTQTVNNLTQRQASSQVQGQSLQQVQTVNNLTQRQLPQSQINDPTPQQQAQTQTVNNLPLRGTVQQPTFNLPLRSTSIQQAAPPVQQTQPVQQQRPVVLSGAVVNPSLDARQVPIVAPSTVVLSGNNNPPRTGNTNSRNPYVNSDDPFEQFAQQDLPPPAILQTKPLREERKNCRKDASCPLVPAEVPRCKKNKDRKPVVWQL